MRGPSGRGASRAEEKGARCRSPGCPHDGKTAFRVCTNHETRNTGFPESRPFPFTGRQIFLLERTRPPTMVFTNHETRVTKRGFFFAVGAQGTHNRKPLPGRTAAHAARSLLSCALWRGMGRLWRGMGGPRPPRRQHGLLGFRQPRITQHVFPLPPGTPRRATPSPANGFFTKHETRVTKHGFYAPLPTISHHFPVKNLSLSQYPRPVCRPRSASRRAPFAGNPTKMHKIPDPTGKCVKHSVRRGSRRPPGLSRFGERNMNPC